MNGYWVGDEDAFYASDDYLQYRGDLYSSYEGDRTHPAVARHIGFRLTPAQKPRVRIKAWTQPIPPKDL